MLSQPACGAPKAVGPAPRARSSRAVAALASHRLARTTGGPGTQHPPACGPSCTRPSTLLPRICAPSRRCLTLSAGRSTAPPPATCATWPACSPPQWCVCCTAAEQPSTGRHADRGASMSIAWHACRWVCCWFAACIAWPPAASACCCTAAATATATAAPAAAARLLALLAGSSHLIPSPSLLLNSPLFSLPRCPPTTSTPPCSLPRCLPSTDPGPGCAPGLRGDCVLWRGCLLHRRSGESPVHPWQPAAAWMPTAC